MTLGDMVQLADGRTGYYQGVSPDGRLLVLVRYEPEAFARKDVKDFKEWNTKTNRPL